MAEILSIRALEGGRIDSVELIQGAPSLQDSKLLQKAARFKYADPSRVELIEFEVRGAGGFEALICFGGTGPDSTHTVLRSNTMSRYALMGGGGACGNAE